VRSCYCVIITQYKLQNTKYTTQKYKLLELFITRGSCHFSHVLLKMNITAAIMEANFIGHQGRCFDLRVHNSDCNQLLSASEDGVAKVWNIGSRACMHTLVHDKAAEVLRTAYLGSDLICTAGSNGQVCLWKTAESVQKVGHLAHRTPSSQVYVCEPCIATPSSATLLSAADNEVLLWDVACQQCVSSWQYQSSDDQLSQEGYGGDSRNPEREVFVFDAKWRPGNSNNEVAVALSDGTIRLLDSRQPTTTNLTLSLDVQELQNAGIKLGHATAVCSFVFNGELF
jgi:WD40 repeat protein